MEVAPVDQRYLDRLLPEPQSGLQAAEATADHHDAVRKADTILATQLGHSVLGSAPRAPRTPRSRRGAQDGRLGERLARGRRRDIGRVILRLARSARPGSC